MTSSIIPHAPVRKGRARVGHETITDLAAGFDAS
jgi:hypothetical protein